MVVVQRRELRRSLGFERLADLTVGTTALSIGVGASFVVMDAALSNTDFSGNSMYQGAWVRVGSGADYRVGTFNVGSGGLAGGMKTTVAIASGGDFELMEKPINATQRDRYIDSVIARLPVRQEVAIPTTDGLTFYSIDAAASPHQIVDVLNVYYFANPGGSLNRERREFTQEQVVLTASGVELRLPGGLAASMQLCLDAILQVALGASDYATVNLVGYRADVVTFGAAAQCYNQLIQGAPSTEAGLYKERRTEMVRQFNVFARQGLPEFAKKLTFESAFEGVHPGETTWT